MTAVTNCAVIDNSFLDELAQTSETYDKSLLKDIEFFLSLAWRMEKTSSIIFYRRRLCLRLIPYRLAGSSIT